MFKIFSRIKLTYLFTNRYLSLARLVLIQLLLMLRPSWNKVEIKLYQRCFNIVSTSHTDVVSTLCNVENPTLDFVSFSTSDQRYFNVDPQRWNNIDPTLKYWLGWEFRTKEDLNPQKQVFIQNLRLWFTQKLKIWSISYGELFV